MPELPPAPTSRLLARLPESDRRALLRLLRPVSLKQGQTLYEMRGPVHHVYFPVNSVLSALVVMGDGTAIEVATVGSEGVVGHAPGGVIERSPHRVISQIAGDALRADARELAAEVARGGVVSGLLDDYHAAFMAQVSQSVACNGLHKVEQRCCRWLLMSRDRVGSDELRLTHEFLAMMLGVRRASVTEVLGPLQDAGLVRTRRGLIAILDREGLEARSCECYLIVRDEYERLLGPL